MHTAVIRYDDTKVIILRHNANPFVVSNSDGLAYELYLWLISTTHLTFEEFVVSLKEEQTEPMFKIAA